MSKRTRHLGTAEARRLAELARAVGLGDSPDEALLLNGDALSLLEGDSETPLLADVLRWQGSVLRDRGRTTDAEPLYRRSLAVAVALAYDAGCAHAMNCLASLAQRRGELVEASSLLADALEIAVRCDERRLVGMIQQNLGIVADMRGNPAAASAYFRVSLRTFEETNDLQPLCWVLNNLGYLCAREERYDDARGLYDRALGIARARGDLMAEGILEQNRAELRLLCDDAGAAPTSIARALDIADQRGDDVRRAAALKLRGACERMCGRAAEAVETLRDALTLNAGDGDAMLGAEILYQYGLALRDQGDAKAARESWQSALQGFERIAARQWVGRVRRRLSGEGAGRYL